MATASGRRVTVTGLDSAFLPGGGPRSRRLGRRAVGRCRRRDDGPPGQGLWDTGLIDDAKALLAGTGSTPPGQYPLQAAITLLHAAALAADHIDWAAIAALYAACAASPPTPCSPSTRPSPSAAQARPKPGSPSWSPP